MKLLERDNTIYDYFLFIVFWRNRNEIYFFNSLIFTARIHALVSRAIIVHQLHQKSCNNFTFQNKDTNSELPTEI